MEVRLDLETFRVLLHGLCLTPQHPLVNPATSDLDSFVCVGGADQPGGRGLSASIAIRPSDFRTCFAEPWPRRIKQRPDQTAKSRLMKAALRESATICRAELRKANSYCLGS